MIRVALAGLGKMGLSHLAIARSHPDVELVAVCDSAGYVLDVLGKYIGLKTYSDYSKLLDGETLDAVLIATPSRFHGAMVRAALERGLHVFCEKPFCLDTDDGAQLVELAARRGLVNQVGYHYRFVGAFQEAKRLLDSGVLGRIHHVRVDAYGPVVIRPKNATWRARKSEGGGCLYDYACHAVDLVQYLLGPVERVRGTVLNRVFSHDVDDEVYASLHFASGATGQLATNWSDESHRKMSTQVTVWGTNGRLAADRQETQLYVRDTSLAPGARAGWTTSYTTELTGEVAYYLRGEEYSAQIDHFVQSVRSGRTETVAPFASALATDRVLRMMLEDSRWVAAGPGDGQWAARQDGVSPPSPKGPRRFFGRAAARLSPAGAAR
jgi:scyllo-inositol 2-dehydrogenase (NADP+)